MTATTEGETMNVEWGWILRARAANKLTLAAALSAELSDEEYEAFRAWRLQ